jgi:hypothetical protein
MNVNPEVFATRLLALAEEHKSVARGLCAMLEVPFLDDRCDEHLQGHRLKEVKREEAIAQGLLPTRRFKFPDGRVVDQDEFPKMSEDADQLTEEVWSKDNWPDCYCTILEAVQKLPHGVTADLLSRGAEEHGYFHKHSLNLGIRRTQFEIPTRSMLADRIAPLASLKKAATA